MRYSFLYKIADTLILILCLPFYVVAVSAMLLYNFLVVHTRHIRLGQEVSHWLKPDIREDLRVVDVSRLCEGMVGVQSRRWNVLYARGHSPPPFSEIIEYRTVKEFWLGRALCVRRRTDGVEGKGVD